MYNMANLVIKVSGFNGQLEMYMKKFEDPKQSDPMSRMQNDLDETKIVLVRTWLHLILCALSYQVQV